MRRSCMMYDRHMERVRALMIGPADNVAVLLDDAQPGDSIDLGDARSVIAAEPIPRGHKVAVHDISPGGVVRKYGSTIGRATAPVTAGSHVHVHNVESERLRGDR